jgi:hypothetical protein
MLKYRYGLGANGATVDVLSLEDETRRSNAPYSCIGCGGALTPNLPKTNRTKYYSHKVEQNCSLETYLHKLAKLTFFETYSAALNLGLPFILSYPRKFLCNAFQESLTRECEGDEIADFDLTSVYKRITLEERIGEFIPDVALVSEKQPPIFIEMVVTHQSTEKKISSGEKIIEITITKEEDLQTFRQRRLMAYGPNVRTYGIKGKPRIGNICGGTCKQESEFFVIYKSGKARVLSAPLHEFHAKRAIYKVLVSTIPSDTGDSEGYPKLVANLRHHMFAGVPIRNCLLCEHQSIGKHSGIWCRAKSEKITSADAIGCGSYKPFVSLAAAKVAEQKNLTERIAHDNALVEKMLAGYR